MSDRRRHRGPHPQDYQLFAPPQWPALTAATADLCWLWTRGYAQRASVQLVGNRYRLTQRQRIATQRAACSDQALQQRRSRQLFPGQLAGEVIHIDGFNLLTTVEAALSFAVLLDCRDGTTRDMASLHGSYRIVEETRPAVEIIGEWLDRCQVGMSYWWFDQPVSNSGRLAAILRDIAAQHGWKWHVTLDPHVDQRISTEEGVVISSDSVILDRCQAWTAATRHLVDALPKPLWRVPLDGRSTGSFPSRLAT